METFAEDHINTSSFKGDPDIKQKFNIQQWPPQKKGVKSIKVFNLNVLC